MFLVIIVKHILVLTALILSVQFITDITTTATDKSVFQDRSSSLLQNERNALRNLVEGHV